MNKKNRHWSINSNVSNSNGLKSSNHSLFIFDFRSNFFENLIHRYEQSKVYQYLKQGDSAYNLLVQRKESLLKTQKLAFNEYLKRRQEFCNDKLLNLSIISIAKSFILRRDQLTKINRMKENLFELENKQKQLIESKNDKMKAWESVYTQPIKRDLMDICLQSNIDQTLTLSFAPIQQITWSQPMTPTPQNEQQIHSKSTVT